MCTTQFAYQGIVGLGYNVNQNFRVNLDGRYYGTTNRGALHQQQHRGDAGPHLQVRPPRGCPAAAAAGADAPSFMVFFDWDRSDLSDQALATIRQAAQAYKSKGSARITATGHTDTSGPESYNMALSLRRANAVKDALVRERRAGRRRSRWSAAARASRWCRPPTACASRRTAASRSSSSRATSEPSTRRNGRAFPAVSFVGPILQQTSPRSALAIDRSGHERLAREGPCQ